MELYYIIDDPAKSKNLAAQNTDTVKKLSSKLEAWTAALPKDYIKDKED